MAFERSTPLARSERTPAERPSEIPRGVMTANGPATGETMTFHLAVGDFVLTYHNASVIDDERGLAVCLVKPDTTVTWERFRG